MPFQTVPVIVAGPSFKDDSRPLSSQETRNFYQDVVLSGRSNYVIKPFPGWSSFGSTTSGKDRGSTVMKEQLYRVVAQTLYLVKQNGTHESKGEVPGSDRCIFANDGVNLFIVTGSIVYHYDGDTITIVTDANIAGSKSVDFINNQFIYTKNSLSTISNVGDGSTASGLNSIGAEYNPDDLVRDYVFDQVIYRFGTRTTESWYNTGEGAPPIARIEGQAFSVGLAALHAVANTDNALYWLGSDKRVYRTRGGVEEVVSNDAISEEISSFADVSDCFMSSFVYEGKSFIVLNFPTENRTLVVSESLAENGWFELSSGKDGDRYDVNSIAYVYGKVLLGHSSNGSVYLLDKDVFDLGGEVFQRRRVMSSINGDSLGAKGKRVQMSRFEFIMELGTGLITGQGEDPRIMLEYSTDGGKSWSEGTWMRTGRLGETDIRAEWWSMISFYDLIIRITTTDPVSFTIYEAAIDLRLAGR